MWISARGHAKHDIRVKISRGRSARPGKLITIALRPEVRVIGKNKLPAKELQQLRQWVKQDLDVLLAYWNGEIFTESALPLLRPLINQ